MNYKLINAIGIIIFFIGLIWMLLPHTYHALITNEDETSHLTHTFQGTIVTFIGLGILIYIKKKK